jgi:hypothetical protein
MAASAAHPATSRAGRLSLPAVPGALRLGRLARSRSAVLAIGVCLALSAVSLALVPFALTYDPWSWLGWGRQILHGGLSTAQGPSWKPFPVLVTTPLALFGSAAPALWLMVARTGALLAALLAFRVARRLTGGGAAGLFAGVLAAVALVFSTGFLRQPAVGNSEGILVALVLFALERHLDGRHRTALVLGAIAGLLRPEMWLFWALYALWLGHRDRRARPLAAGLALGVLALWFVPEWLGSGDPLRAAVRASEPERNSLAFASHPASAIVEAARGALMTWARAGVLVATLIGGLAAARGVRFARPLLALAAAALAWDFAVAIMTWVGFAGNPRYLMGATALFAVTGAAAAGLILREVAARSRPLALVAGAALAAVAGVQVAHRTASLPALHDSLAYYERVNHDIPEAIAQAGGRERLLGCGSLTVEKFSRPLASWYLDVPIGRLQLERGWPGLALATRPAPDAAYSPVTRRTDAQLAAVGTWRVLASPACVLAGG